MNYRRYLFRQEERHKEEKQIKKHRLAYLGFFNQQSTIIYQQSQGKFENVCSQNFDVLLYVVRILRR
jgi:hypothetical protein